jgi:hypothetical protein
VIVARGLGRGPGRGALVAFGLCLALLSGDAGLVEPPPIMGLAHGEPAKRRIRPDALHEVNALLADDEEVATALCLLFASGAFNDFDLT